MDRIQRVKIKYIVFSHFISDQVAGLKFTKDNFFSLKKKSSLPGGQSHYSLQRSVGGALGLAADLPARIGGITLRNILHSS